MEHVTLQSLAEELKMDRSNLRKYVMSEGMIPMQVRTLASRGQKTLAVTEDEAERIRQGLAWRLKEMPVTTGPGFRIEQIPLSANGLAPDMFNALVIRGNIPERIAGLIYYYYQSGFLAAAHGDREPQRSMAIAECQEVQRWAVGDGQ